MRRAIPIIAILFLATSVFAQRGERSSPGSGKSSSNNSAQQQPASQPSAPQQNHQHHQNQQGRQFKGRVLSNGPSTTYVNPFNQEHHYTTQGSGCYNCGYGVYGGYVYPGAYPAAESNGGTATDAILANGGTFNNINPPADSSYPQSSDKTQQQLYIRPEYPEHYDNSYNTPLAQGQQVVSAASDTPAILVFKDGTKIEVHNYAIYGAYIVVLAPERKKYPIAALDVDATQKANEAAGYDFKLPAVFTSH